MKKGIVQLSEEIKEKVTHICHDIHQHPETGCHEYRTAEVIETFLSEVGVSHRRCTETGVVAVIGKGDGHTVALRADMDALPMPDSGGFDSF